MIHHLRMKNILIIVLVFSMLFLCGCMDSIEVDEMVYVVAMGIDAGTNGNLRITLLMAVPIAVGVGPEPGEIDKSTNAITVEAPTILGGVNVVNSSISKKVNFSHAKLIVISEELAEKGVERFLNTFIRFREFRPDTYLGISRGNAEEFLKSSKPVLEINPSKHIELIMESFEYTGFSNGSTIEEFYSKVEDTSDEAVAALLDISQIEQTTDLAKTFSNLTVMEGDYKAGDTPVVYENKVRQMGSAVFKEDKMVGKLTGRETLYYLMASGKLGEIYYTLPDPNEKAKNSKDNSDYVTLRLSQARKPEINVKLKDEKPAITVKISLEGDILSITGKEDYSTGEGLEKLEKYASEYVQQDVISFLEKTRDEFKSDICSTGKSIRKTFLFWEDWVDFKWTEKYEKADFFVGVAVKIRRSGIMVKQIPVDQLKGDMQ